MADESPKVSSIEIMIKQLVLVFLGLIVVVMVLVLVGAAGDRYFSAKDAHKQTALEKQEAFAQAMTYEEYKRSKQEREVSSVRDILEQEYEQPTGQTAVETPEETPSVTVEEAFPTDKPILAPGQMILPEPDLTITEADSRAMSGKAAVFYTSIGSFVVELYPDKAPRTVKNFSYLVKNGFYNGLYFYRIYPGTFVEAGSPNGRRGGTAGYWIDMEISGAIPNIGTVALVQVLNKSKVGSEMAFFTKDADAFKERCSVFGRIVDRYNVLEKIADSRTDKNGYADDRVYIAKIAIVDMKDVAPAEDIWADQSQSQ